MHHLFKLIESNKRGSLAGIIIAWLSTIIFEYFVYCSNPDNLNFNGWCGVFHSAIFSIIFFPTLPIGYLIRVLSYGILPIELILGPLLLAILGANLEKRFRKKD